MYMEIYPVINGIYKHYKGGVYKVLFLSKHTETDEVLVNYKSLIFGSFHSRPLQVWNQTHLINNTEAIAKFQLIESPSSVEPTI